MRTSKEVRTDNKMLRFQVEQLWKDLKAERTRGDQAVHSRRMSAKIRGNVIDELRAENEKLNALMEPTMKVTAARPEPEPSVSLDTGMLLVQATLLLRHVMANPGHVVYADGAQLVGAETMNDIKTCLDAPYEEPVEPPPRCVEGIDSLITPPSVIVASLVDKWIRQAKEPAINLLKRVMGCSYIPGCDNGSRSVHAVLVNDIRTLLEEMA